ncbi:LysM peptidoglycan-binding domain-containing protein [Modestobacter versicolor]|uniref:LysM peptidoglycan-binding domain-containing protein n=1 Tax=Modestobacter versicolor TaxID=429133 RepID=UPI0034DEE4CE
MSLRRWAGTTVVMAAGGWLLWVLGPTLPELRTAAADPQGLVDRAGADALLLAVVPALAWLCWAWGAVGLLLTVASTVPGGAGRLAGVLLTVVLPAGARRAAALALGVGLATTAPALVAAPLVVPVTASAPTDVGTGAEVGDVVPVDWPGAPLAQVVPDWPQVGPDDHVVVRGDCLWDIAARRLALADPGGAVTAADVRQAVQDWWQANAAVIGPDPDLLLPGQVLRPPG